MWKIRPNDFLTTYNERRTEIIQTTVSLYSDDMRNFIQVSLPGDRTTYEDEASFVEECLVVWQKKYLAELLARENNTKVDQVTNQIDAVSAKLDNATNTADTNEAVLMAMMTAFFKMNPELTTQEFETVSKRFPKFKVGKQYKTFDVVQHEGKAYRVISDFVATDENTPNKDAHHFVALTYGR